MDIEKVNDHKVDIQWSLTKLMEALGGGNSLEALHQVEEIKVDIQLLENEIRS